MRTAVNDAMIAIKAVPFKAALCSREAKVLKRVKRRLCTNEYSAFEAGIV